MLSGISSIGLWMTDGARSSLVDAARVVSGEGLTDAFGHLSVRVSPADLLITPPVALSLVASDHEFATLTVGADSLPDAAPKEGWIHLAIAHERQEVGAICRAQPPAVAALVATGESVRALHGHGSFLGDVPVYEDSRLIRDPDSGRALSEIFGDASAVIMRGNGAVTTGPDLASAVALMWVLEKSARLNLQALAAGTPRPLPDDEQEWWRKRQSELLPRIYTYLSTTHRKEH